MKSIWRQLRVLCIQHLLKIQHTHSNLLRDGIVRQTQCTTICASVCGRVERQNSRTRAEIIMLSSHHIFIFRQTLACAFYSLCIAHKKPKPKQRFLQRAKEKCSRENNIAKLVVKLPQDKRQKKMKITCKFIESK